MAKKMRMEKVGPIILVDDDIDDRQLMKDALEELGIANKLVQFDLCAEAFDYLKSTSAKPLIIFCDVNLPQQSGIEFKRQVDDDEGLREKSIPFVLFSTAVEKRVVDIAYKELTVQGFFQKPVSFQKLKDTIGLIIAYWALCVHPNS